MNCTTLADMHTHSENSHDSNCKIEDMVLSQIEKGTRIFAVTDHFDTYLHQNQDIFTPIKTAYDTVLMLNEKYKDKCTILTGVEISEGFWHPEIYDRILKLCDYDVVIGSVHVVRSEKIPSVYAFTDFSKYENNDIADFLDAYFDDVLDLLKYGDFDILAHLTCPLRYAVGKYGATVDMSRYDEKIEKILKKAIEKGVSLEVNTSLKYYKMLNEFTPCKEILKKYYSLGGRMVTLGSDAHVADNASCYFKEAAEMLKDIGFEHIYYYVKRKPYAIKI